MTDPYRTEAEVPEYTEEKESVPRDPWWTPGRKVLAGAFSTLAMVNVGAFVAQWGHIGQAEIGSAIVLNSLAIGFVALVAFVVPRIP